MDTPRSFRTRVKPLNTHTPVQGGQCVLYVMSRDCRVRHNHALLAARQHAHKLGVPVVVAFVAYDKRLGQRAAEHAWFLLQGLGDVAQGLQSYNIPFIVRTGSPRVIVPELVQTLQAAAVYFDFSPLRHAVAMKQQVASAIAAPAYVVDTHNIVPVWVASDKQEIGARTLRPKIHHHLRAYIHAEPKLQPQLSTTLAVASEPLATVTQNVARHYPSNGTDISRFVPGEQAACKALMGFITHNLRGYGAKRNDPSVDGTSDLSPYLHYGQLSSLEVVLAAHKALAHDTTLQPDVDALVEEMVVRKELSDNFCYYNPQYDSLAGAPAWAQATLTKHQADPRDFTYTLQQFEQAATHDPAWNAAQRQLTRTGKIHGYMRMYWAKKVLEWSATPAVALQTLLYLNDFYHLDGGDPNGYVGILWSVAGVHDRPWGERSVYGTIRSMVYSGLKRKFDIQAYIERYS